MLPSIRHASVNRNKIKTTATQMWGFCALFAESIDELLFVLLRKGSLGPITKQQKQQQQQNKQTNKH